MRALALLLLCALRAAGDLDATGDDTCTRDPSFEDVRDDEAGHVEAAARCLARCLAGSVWDASCENVTCTEDNTKVAIGMVAASGASAPRLRCRTETALVVEWTPPPQQQQQQQQQRAVYVVTVRAAAPPWRHRVVTTDPYVTVEGLTSGDIYQFRVQVMIQDAWLGYGCDSDWISTFNDTLKPLPVTSVNVTGVTDYSEDKVTIGIKWEAAKDKVCNYKLIYWNTQDTNDFLRLQEKKKVFSTFLKDLKFGSTYELAITSLSSSPYRESTNVSINFTTPSCLELHNNNLNICSPPPPRFINVSFLDTGKGKYDILCSWIEADLLPRTYVATLTQLSPSPDTPEKARQQIRLPWNVTNHHFENIKLDTSYAVCVRAESPAGNSTPVCDYRKLKTPLGVATASGYNATIFVVLLTVVLVLVSVVLMLCYRQNKKREQKDQRSRYFEGLEKQMPKDEQDLISRYHDDEWEIAEERLEVTEYLDGGAFGVVHKGLLKGATPLDPVQVVAVKMLKDVSSSEDERQFLREIEVMKAVGKHPHIVSMIGCCTCSQPTKLVVEYCDLGNLEKYLGKVRKNLYQQMSPIPNKSVNMPTSNDIKYAELMSNKDYAVDTVAEVTCNKGGIAMNEMYFRKTGETNESKYVLTPVDLLSFARQIAIGMEFLASSRIVHRDVAARNILVCSNKIVKITDFGLSRDVYEQNIYFKKSNGKMPVKWMAIESLLYKVYTTQSDVWSFGILLWEMVTLGGTPYPSTPPNRLFKLLQTGYRMECPSNCSQELYDIMLACWRSKWKERPTFSELCKKLDVLLESASPQQYLNLNMVTQESPVTSLSTVEHPSSHSSSGEYCNSTPIVALEDQEGASDKELQEDPSTA